jgi:hypothetical protein
MSRRSSPVRAALRSSLPSLTLARSTNSASARRPRSTNCRNSTKSRSRGWATLAATAVSITHRSQRQPDNQGPRHAADWHVLRRGEEIPRLCHRDHEHDPARHRGAQHDPHQHASENLADIQEKDRYNVVLANPPSAARSARKRSKTSHRTGERCAGIHRVRVGASHARGTGRQCQARDPTPASTRNSGPSSISYFRTM